jgi:4-carboxymuconolactone decarboxylase
MDACQSSGQMEQTMQQHRFPQYQLENTREGEQRALAERMLRETRAGLGGPWNVMLRSPKMGNSLMDLYNHFRHTTPLPQSIVEFAILLTAREIDSSYEWLMHHPLALRQGVPAAQLDDVRNGRRPAALTPELSAVYDFAIELLRHRVVSDATFATAKQALGEQGVVDLTALIGVYAAIGALLSVGEVAAPAGDGPQFLPTLAR